MRTPGFELTKKLCENPEIVLIYEDPTTIPPILHVYIKKGHNHPREYWVQQLQNENIIIHESTLPQILRTSSVTWCLDNKYQRCQNIPIQLGCQIQPANSNWVGTAGIPVKYKQGPSQIAYGILSNWHVMADGGERLGRTQHQPTVGFNEIAWLEKWETVRKDRVNYLDAAIANAWVREKHSIRLEVIDIGRINPYFSDAYVGLKVQKVGRTTGLTKGTCIGTNASAQVSYGTFTATFEGLDVYSGGNSTFSAPGDSGSGIFNEDKQPVSLLFAGNNEITLGIPLRTIVKAFDLLPLEVQK